MIWRKGELVSLLELVRVGPFAQGDGRPSLCPGLSTDGPLALGVKSLNFTPFRTGPCCLFVSDQFGVIESIVQLCVRGTHDM